jgi:hypothetical protein
MVRRLVLSTAVCGLLLSLGQRLVSLGRHCRRRLLSFSFYKDIHLNILYIYIQGWLGAIGKAPNTCDQVIEGSNAYPGDRA